MLKGDAVNGALLVLLYLLQGIPLGLVFGSVPFLLKSKASYAELATFSLASYPYSLKLFWSPFVDTIYVKWLGRRKTWIVPTQLIIGSFFVWLGSTGWIDEQLAAAPVPITKLTAVFFVLVVVAATQDIAVDSWGLTLLSKDNISFASTAQSIGLNSGFFLSFTVLLALGSPEFCNSYLRDTPGEEGIVYMGGYMTFWGLAMIVTTAFVLVFKHEGEDDAEVGTPGEVFVQMKKIVRRPPMYKLIALLLLHKVGFSANDNVTGLKLLEKGFKKEDLAFTVLLDFPTQIALGLFIGRWAKTDSLRPWYLAQWGRLAVGFVATLLVMNVPEDGPGSWYFWAVVGGNLLGSSMRSVMFIAQGAFFAQIADPVIAGTYLTLLNTLSNLGGTWHNYFVLQAVEMLSITECVGHGHDAGAGCGTDAERSACVEGGHECVVRQDGYVVVSMALTVVGVLVLYLYVRPTIALLRQQPLQAWRVASPP